MLQLKLGLSLESLQMPLRAALRAAAELGGHAVEINARRDLRPEELSRTGVRHLRKLLADLNLTVCSLTFPTAHGLCEPKNLERRVDAVKAVMTAAQSLGAAVVVAPLGSVDSVPDSPSGALCRQVLLDLGRHGHRVGSLLAAQTTNDFGEPLLKLLADLPAGILGIDFDPGTLLYHGHSPEKVLQEVASHVLSVRAVDAVRDGAGQARYVQVGRGSVDFPWLFGRLEEAGYRGFVIVEPRNLQNPLVACQQTVEYLQSLF